MRPLPRRSTLERLFAGHHDVLAALRSLRRSPGFVAIAVLSLGLAVGLNTTTLSMIDAIINPYVPYPAAERLFNLEPYGGSRSKKFLQREMYLGVRARTDLYARIVPYLLHGTDIRANGHLLRGLAYEVGAGFFDVLGVKPAVGRSFSASDTSAEDGAAVISYQLWEEEFGGDSHLTDLQLTFNGKIYSVIGVMPPGVNFPIGAEFWFEMPRVQETSTAGPEWVRALVELKSGDTQPRVKAQLEGMLDGFAAEYNGRRADFDFRLESLIPRGHPPRGATLFAGLISFTILLVACLNLANLMLARGLGRRRELAVRMALGAGRGAIVRHVLVEGGILTLLGGSWGVVLSVWGVKLAESHMPAMIRQMGFTAPHLSWRVVAIGIAVTAATILISGAAPSLHAVRANVADAMKDGGGGSTGRPSRLYRLVVVGEIALALGVMIVAMVYVGEFGHDASFRFPYDAAHVLLGTVAPGKSCDSSVKGDARSFWTHMTRRVRAVPGVRYAAAITTMYPRGQVVTSDQPGVPIERVLGRGMQLGYTVTTPDYFRVFGFSMIAGRDFEPGDADSGGVAIVNRDLAKRLWPFTSPVGRLIKLGAASTAEPWVRVVGVVGSLNTAGDSVSDDAPLLTVARPFGCMRATMAVRTGGPGAGPKVASAVRNAVDAAVPGGGMVSEFRSSRADYDASLRVERTAMLAYLSCGLFALLLSAVGVYGVLNYAVGQRTREFAMRSALGAQSGHLIRIVARDAAEMVIGGTALGEVAVLVIMVPMLRGSGSLAFAAALVAAEVVVICASLAACIAPVRRAIRADPVDLLRAT